MMSLGSSGPSSSFSNLSASAPPFTIDEFSSNPNSNPLVHYGDVPYTAPFGHTWQYTPTPSAPQPRVEGDSTKTSAFVLASKYSFLDPDYSPSSTQWPAISPCDTSAISGFYGSEARPYHSPVVSGESSSLALSCPVYDRSSQGDYSEHLDFQGYTPHWQRMWKGELSHGNQVGPGGNSATEKLNESSPFVYKNYINQGPTIQSGDKSREDSVVLRGSSTDDIQMGSHDGSFNAGFPDGKPLFSKNHDAGVYTNPIDGTEKNRFSKSFNIMNIDGRSKSFNMLNVDGESLYSQNLGHFEISGTQFPGPTSSFPEFSSPSAFQESSKCFIDNQKTYGSQESCIQPCGLFVKDPISPMKPYCTVFNKVPSNNTSSSLRDTEKIVGNRIASNCGSKLWDTPHLPEEKGHFMSTRAESTEGSCYTNKTNKEVSYWNIPSTSKGEVPTSSQLEDSIDFVLSNRPAPQMIDTNVSYSMDYVQSYKYTEDSLENQILALDSPCWKGAQASYSSHNNIIESLPGIQFLKGLDGCLDIPGNLVDSKRVASQDLSIGNANFRTGCAAKDELPSQTSISESSFAAKELNTDVAAKELLNSPYPGSSKGGQFLNDSDNPRKEHNLSNIFLGNQTKYSCSNQCNVEHGLAPVEENLHASIRDGVTSCNEAADAGAVAYHAAENVLYSPPAQEAHEEHHQPPVKVATQLVDIPALVKAMHSISELLRSNCSADSFGLTEENQESLKSVIKNLDSCLSKKVDLTPVSEFVDPQQSTSIRTGDGGGLGKTKGADQPHQNSQGTVASSGELGDQNIHNENISCSDYGNQARRLPYCLPSEQYKSISSDGKMVQAIKKVLDENFNFEEEMQSQVLLFKNLWLEAEARLCSISYQAHFNHMKILMDGYKLNNGKGSAEDAKASISITNQSSSGVATIANNVHTSLFPRFNSSSVHGDGISPDELPKPGIPSKTEGRFGGGYIEACGAEVLARLIMLKKRDDKPNEVQQQSNVLDTNSPGRQYGSSSGTSNPEIQVNHAEATLLARLNILKQRDNNPNEVQQQPNAHDTKNSGLESVSSIGIYDPENQINYTEAAALARLNILKQRDIRSSAEESQNIDTRKAVGQLDSSIFYYGYESLKDFSQGSPNHQVIHPGRDNNQDHSAGSHDSSSSEWEHVHNDDFSWQKG